MWLNDFTIKVNEPLNKALLTRALQEKTNMTSQTCAFRNFTKNTKNANCRTRCN